MDWAKDQLGNLVMASQPSSFSYGLRCPQCLKPVFKRSGSYRRPHFAHYGYGGTAECELYHPSESSTVAPVAIQRARTREPEDFAPWQLGGLFLRRTSIGGFAFLLRLPRLREEFLTEQGEIRVVTGLGTHHYAPSQLQTPQFLPVVPGVPIVQVFAPKGLSYVLDAIVSSASVFGASGNFFKIGDSATRLLQPDAPLEMGESYWLITRTALPQKPPNLHLSLRLDGIRRGWHYFELTLPATDDVTAPGAETHLSSFLGRKIRAASHRACFVEPPAHHIEGDGTHIVPEGTEAVVVRKSNGARINAYAANDLVLTEEADDPEWCRISGLRSGDFAVYVDAKEHLLARIEQCPLYSPPGVTASSAESTTGPLWQLDGTALGIAAEIEIKCPTIRVARYIEERNEGARREGLTIRLAVLKNRTSIVDAGNFGVVLGREAAPSQPTSEIKAPEVPAKRTWLEGVARRYLGPTHYSAQKFGELAASFSKVAWLSPHFQSIAGRRDDGL